MLSQDIVRASVLSVVLKSADNFKSTDHHNLREVWYISIKCMCERVCVNNLFISDLTGLIPLRVRVSAETAKTERWEDKKRKGGIRAHGSVRAFFFRYFYLGLMLWVQDCVGGKMTGFLFKTYGLVEK